MLPIYSIKDALMKAIIENPILTVVGETGSGKTTQLPQWLLDKYKKIAITQPRRVAAVTVADRVSEELAISGQYPASVCGYKIRFVDKTTEKTRLLFMTDGVLLRILQNDPVLRDFEAIILDEAHERALETDILFGIMKVIHQKRPDLRIIIMSATLDSDKFSKYFNFCPIVEIPGRHFDVDIHHMRSGNVDSSNFVKKSIETALYAHQNYPKGDILVFLTGQGEIEYACRALEDLDDELEYDRDVSDKSVNGLKVLPLYASLDPRDQRKVFSPTRDGIRKVVFSTNIAATSVTIPNIVYVIDSGFVKQKEYDSKLDMDALLVTRISRGAADQRAGRAGRTSHGICWRLYSTEEYEEMDDATCPEIQRTSLTSTVLVLKKLGILNVLDFPFMDPPETSSILTAGKQLYYLSALSADGSLTETGDHISKFPISPALARVVLASCSEDLACSKEVVTICAALSSEEVFFKPRKPSEAEEAEAIHRKWRHRSGDHLTLLNIVEGFRVAHAVSYEDAKDFCRRNYLKQKTLKTILDIDSQLLELLHKLSLPILTSGQSDTNDRIDTRREYERSVHYEFINQVSHKAILKSFLHAYYTNLAKRHANKPSFYHYASTQQTKPSNDSSIESSGFLALTITPGSVLIGDNQEVRGDIEWVVYHNIMYTNRATMRVVSKVYLDWVPEELLGRLKEKVDEERLVGDPSKLRPVETVEEQVVEVIEKKVEARPSSEDIESAKERYLARKKQKTQ